MPPTAPATRRSASPRRATKKRRITPEDLGRLRLLSDPQISPDGTEVIFVHCQVGERNEYASNLWRVDVESRDARPFTSGNRDTQPRFSPDGSRVAFVGARDKHCPQIYTIETTGGEATALSRLPEGTIGAFRWSPDGTCLVATFREQDPEWTKAARKHREEHGLSDPPRVLDHWWYRLDGDGYFNAQRYHLVRIDAETGEHRRLFDGDTLGFLSFDFSPDGRHIVVATDRRKRAGLTAANDELLRLNVATGRATPIPGLPAGPKTKPQWSPDGRTIAYAGRVGDDGPYGTENLELWVCDPIKGRARSLTGNTDYCLMAGPMSDTAEPPFSPEFRWRTDSRGLLVQLGWRGECHLASIPRRGGRVDLLTRGARAHWLGSVAGDGRTIALTVGTPTMLNEVYVADIGGTSADLTTLTDLNRSLLREVDVARPRSQWVRTADGTRVQVWTMLPPGAGPRQRHPAVIQIHGGPHTQYGACFFHEFQVLAAAGYAVIYSNPRGSKGYGRDHCAAIRGDWGSADWVDMQAVIDFVREHPSVDAKRMGVMGGSYGGYMTNWIIGHTDVFAGAITDRCVSNVVGLAGTSDFVTAPDRYFPGNHWDRPEAMWDQSPIKHIGDCRTPTLIIHSEGDLRCNVAQAEQLYTALTLLKVPTRFVRYPQSTSHGLSRSGPPDLRIHRLHQILDWWAKYLRKR